MTKQNQPIETKHEHEINMHWQQVLAFGVAAVEVKTQQQRPTHTPVFDVLP